MRCIIWKNITEIATGFYFTIGLKNDGTIVFTGKNIDKIENITSWSEILTIDGNYYTAVGVEKTGSYVGAGAGVTSYYEPNDPLIKEIKDVSFGGAGAIILNTDGTVVAVGDNTYKQCEVEDWRDIIAIATGWNIPLGLKKMEL